MDRLPIETAVDIVNPDCLSCGKSMYIGIGRKAEPSDGISLLFYICPKCEKRQTEPYIPEVKQ